MTTALALVPSLESSAPPAPLCPVSSLPVIDSAESCSRYSWYADPVSDSNFTSSSTDERAGSVTNVLVIRQLPHFAVLTSR